MYLLSSKLSLLSDFKPLLLAAMGFSMSACASVTGDDSNLFYTQDFPVVSENTLALNARQDQFRVGDTADVSVFEVEALTNSYAIDREGNINFPLIGVQQVAGLTTLELQQKLVFLYGENYLQTPNVTVKREANLLGNIVVDGAVSNPGLFELYNPVRLTEAVALAGGLDEGANSKEVYVVREIEGIRKVKVVNLKGIRRTGATDIEIYPQDIVFVKNSTSKAAYDEFIRIVPALSTLLLLGTR